MHFKYEKIFIASFHNTSPWPSCDVLTNGLRPLLQAHHGSELSYFKNFLRKVSKFNNCL